MLSVRDGHFLIAGQDGVVQDNFFFVEKDTGELLREILARLSHAQHDDSEQRRENIEKPEGRTMCDENVIA